MSSRPSRTSTSSTKPPPKSNSMLAASNSKHPVLEGIDGERLYYEDDEWTPSMPMLLFMGMVTLLVAAGIGVGAWQAYEKRGRGSEDVGGPTLSPTMSPTITASPTTIDEKFVCNICGMMNNAELTNPGTTISIPSPSSTNPTSNTCEEWQRLGQDGAISRDDCVLFLPNVVEPCGCTEAPTTSPTISPSPTIMTTQLPSSLTTQLPSSSNVFECNLCGTDASPDESITDPTGIIPNVPSLGNLTCSQLEQFAASGVIPESLCNDQLFAAVSTNCGGCSTTSTTANPTTNNGTVSSCLLCDDGGPQEVTNPDDIVTLPFGQPSATCQQLLVSVVQQAPANDAQCTFLQQAFQDVCICVGGGGDEVLGAPDNVNNENPETATTNNNSTEDLVVRYLR